MSTNFLHGFYLADFIMVIVAVLVGYVSGVLQHGFGHSSSTTVCVRPITFSCDIIDFTPEKHRRCHFFLYHKKSKCLHIKFETIAEVSSISLPFVL